MTQGTQTGAQCQPRGWGGEGRGRGVRVGRDMGKPTADSC